MLNILYHLRNSQINSNKNDVMSAQDGVSYCTEITFPWLGVKERSSPRLDVSMGLFSRFMITFNAFSYKDLKWLEPYETVRKSPLPLQNLESTFYFLFVLIACYSNHEFLILCIY